MKRLLLIWAALAAAYIFARTASSYFASGNLQLPGEAWAHIALLPLFQALTLQCLTAAGRQERPFRQTSIALRNPLVLLLTISDLIVLGAGWLGEDQNWAQLGQPANLASYYLAAKAVSLGTYVLLRLFPVRSGKLEGSAYAVLTGVCLMLAAERSLALLWPPTAWTILACLGAAALVTLYFSWRSQSAPAAAVLNWALLVLLPVFLILASSLFRSATADEPWTGIVMSLTLVALTLLWMSALLQRRAAAAVAAARGHPAPRNR